MQAARGPLNLRPQGAVGLTAYSIDSARAVAVQRDGKVVVAGSSSAQGDPDFALVRYTARGKLDSFFGIGGTVLTDLGAKSRDFASAVVIQPDGKIIAAGESQTTSEGSFMTLTRYTSSGKLDASFGLGGKVVTDLGRGDDGVSAMAVQGDGKIVTAGYRDPGVGSGGVDFAVVRYTPTGSLDATFGSGGKVVTNLIGGSEDRADAVAIQRDGKIVAAGESSVLGDSFMTLVRYTTAGRLDPAFGTGGKVVLARRSASGVVIQKDDKIVVAGPADVKKGEDFALVRLTRAGRLDKSFGSSGTKLTDFAGSFDWAYAVAVQADGKIVACGSSSREDHDDDFALVRVTPVGRPDPRFGRSGKVVTDVSGGSHDRASAVALQADGKIVAAGTVDGDIAVVRYTTGGRLDATFGSGGKVVTDLGLGIDDRASAAAVQADGKIVVAGWSDAGGSYDFALVRYTTEGRLDAGFGSGGKVLTDLGRGSDDRAYAVAVQKDGKIVAAGTRETDRGLAFPTSDFALVRYTASGTLDATFGVGGVVLTHFDATAGVAAAVAIQNDGKIVVAGSIERAYTSFALARYTSAGRLDTGFGRGGTVVTGVAK